MGVIGGFYYCDELAGPQGAHFHFWIGDFGPNSPEVKRALHEAKSNHDVVSWSYSRCLPKRPVFGSDFLPHVAPPIADAPINLDKAIAISEATNDGRALTEEDSDLLWRAYNDRLDAAGQQEFDRLHDDVVNSRYDMSRMWLLGVENVTRDDMGYVYWRGKNIEHFSHDDPNAMRIAAQSLSLVCRYLERTGCQVNSSSYFQAWDEFREFEGATKYFITWPSNLKDASEVRVHPYRTSAELGEALKVYVTDWGECPIKSAQELREVYCPDDTWETAKHLDPRNEDDRKLIAARCACEDGTARAIIKAAKTGQPQHALDGRDRPMETWIRETFIRDHLSFDYIDKLEYANELISIYSDETGRYDYCPPLAEVVRGIVEEGKLRPEVESLQMWLDAVPDVRRSAVVMVGQLNNDSVPAP